MKKRKILLGLELAAAAVFSLSACGDDTTPTTTPTTEGDGGSGTGTGTGTGEGTGTGTGTGTPTTEKVNVKFYEYVSGDDAVEITSAKQEINKGSKATALTSTAKDGYKFIGYYTSQACTEEFDFNTTINKDTKVYLLYEVLTQYDILAADTNNVLAYNFQDATKDAKLAAFDKDHLETTLATKGVYASNSTTNYAKYSEASGNKYIETVDEGADTTFVCVGVGTPVQDKLVKIYAEVDLSSSTKMGSKWPVFQLLGINSSDKVFEGFAFGANADKAEGYRVTGTDEGWTKVSADSGALGAKLYKIYIELNTVSGALTMKVNGEDYLTASTSINKFAGLRLQTAGSAQGTERVIKLDNVAINAENPDLTAVKTDLKANLQSYYDAYVESDKATQLGNDEWTPIETANTTGAALIDAATDLAGAKSAYSTACTGIDTAVTTLRAAKVIELKQAINNWTWSDDSATNTKYGALSPEDQATIDSSLATLKTEKTADASVNNIKNIKDGYTYLNDFISAAKNLVKDKVTVTVRYYKFEYTAATITEFAQGTTYYTLNDAGVYLAVAADATFDGTATYYTRAAVSVNTEKTFQVLEGNSATENNVEDLTGYFITEYYANDTLTTKYDFANTKINDNNTVIYAVVSKTLFVNMSDVSTGDIVKNTAINRYTIVTAIDGAAVTVEANAKSADGIDFTNRMKLNGGGATNKRSIKFTVSGSAKLTAYVMSGKNSEARTFAIKDSTFTNVTGGTAAISGDDISTMTATLSAAGDYYACSNKAMNVYGIVITLD